MNKKYLEIFINVGLVLFIIFKFFLSASITDAISYASLVSLFLSSVYSKYLWKRFRFHNIPILLNNYKVKLEYLYDGKMHSKVGEVEIYQDLFSVRVVLKTDESFSKSLIANIYLEQDVWYLTYTYINEPHQNNRDKSKIHYGTCKLNLNDLNNIKGEYFTDRLSCGDISFFN